MAVILLATGLYLLMQGCLCSVGETNSGCMRWTPSGDNVCCDACHPGHRLVKDCGPRPKDLCTPCEAGTFTKNPKDYRCIRCAQCIGAQIHVKDCTATTDTVCGCREGLLCGNAGCSFCIERCDKGQEPAEKRSCRPCPPGTFNDQIHQKCKPWSTKCPHPDESIVAQGDKLTDVKCANFTIGKVQTPTQPDSTGQAWYLVFPAVATVLLVAIFIIIIVARKTLREREEDEEEEVEKPTVKTPIITTPTDDPRTLIAIECSFHEAQQEQGSSSESLASKDSSGQLIG